MDAFRFGPDEDDDDRDSDGPTNGPGWDDGVYEQEDKWYSTDVDDD